MRDGPGRRLSPAARSYSARYVRYVVLLLSVVYVLNQMDRMALAVLAPLIKADLNLSDAQLGLLTGLAFSLFFAVCGIPIARWADRGVRSNIIAMALAIWSAMTALCGAAQNAWQLFIARVGVGVGEAGCVPPSHSMLCDYVPFKRRPGTLAIHQFGAYVGLMLGMALAGRLGQTLSWRATFILLGLPGIALAALVRLTLHEPTRGGFDAVQESPRSLGETLRMLWYCKTYRLITMFCVVNGFVQYGANQWWPSFYARVHGLGLAFLGTYLGIAIGVGAGIGVLIGGLAANRAIQRDIRRPLILGAAATAFALPAALASLFATSSQHSLLFVALTSFFWSIPLGSVTTALYSVMPPGIRATGGAIAVFAVSAIGYSLGPYCVGLMSDLLAPSYGMQSLRYALLTPVCFIPVMVFFLYRSAKALPADLQAVGAQFTERETAGDKSFAIASQEKC